MSGRNETTGFSGMNERGNLTGQTRETSTHMSAATRHHENSKQGRLAP